MVALCDMGSSCSGHGRDLQPQQLRLLLLGSAMSLRMVHWAAGPPAHLSEQASTKRARLRSSPRDSAMLVCFDALRWAKADLFELARQWQAGAGRHQFFGHDLLVWHADKHGTDPLKEKS